MQSKQAWEKKEEEARLSGIPGMGPGRREVAAEAAAEARYRYAPQPPHGVPRGGPQQNAAATRIQSPKIYRDQITKFPGLVDTIQRGRAARSHKEVGESSFNFNDELNEVGCEKCGKTENTIKTVNSKGNTVVYCSSCI